MRAFGVESRRVKDFRFQIADCRFQIADCKLQIPIADSNCRLQISNCRFRFKEIPNNPDCCELLKVQWATESRPPN